MTKTMTKITRAQLQYAIEEGIDQAPAMTDEQKMMLRHVGATAERVTYGTFHMRDERDEECGCPLWQAGLAYEVPDSYLGCMRTADGVGGFYSTFDHKIESMVGYQLCKVLEVTG